MSIHEALLLQQLLVPSTPVSVPWYHFIGEEAEAQRVSFPGLASRSHSY